MITTKYGRLERFLNLIAEKLRPNPNCKQDKVIVKIVKFRDCPKCKKYRIQLGSQLCYPCLKISG